MLRMKAEVYDLGEKSCYNINHKGITVNEKGSWHGGRFAAFEKPWLHGP
jgi:hypothetical protein